MAKKHEKNLQITADDIHESIDKLINNALAALEEYMKMSQEQVDAIVQAMALAGLDNHMLLAKMAVEETGRGFSKTRL